MFIVELGDRRIGHHLSLCRAGIPLNLLKARVPSYSCDLMRTRTSFGECRGARLAQAVSRAVMQARLIAASTEPIAEASWGEGAAELCNQEGQVSGRRRRNAGLKFGVQWDINIDRVAMLVLRLPEFDPAIAQVLRTEPNGILTTAARVEQEVEREACLAADRVSIAILDDFGGAP
jgi:hypothetical protein